MFDKSQLLQVLSQLLFGMLGALVIQLLFIHKPQKTVTVDITAIVKSFETEALKQKLTAEELQQKVSQFGISLNNTMASFSTENDYILVPKEVVISGALDKTEDVKNRIKKSLSS